MRLIPGLTYDRLDEKGDLSPAGRQLIRAVNDLLAFHNGQIPTYASNAAALAAGLRKGAFYATSSGEVRIVV